MTTAYYAKGIPQCVLPFSIFNALATMFATVPMFLWLGIAGVGLMHERMYRPSSRSSRWFWSLKALRRAPQLQFLGGLFSSFGGILGLSAVLFSLVHFGLDRPLGHVAPVVGFLHGADDRIRGGCSCNDSLTLQTPGSGASRNEAAAFARRPILGLVVYPAVKWAVLSVPYLGVIVPAFNEEARLQPTLKRSNEYYSQQDYTWRVIVVSDGSTDSTNQVVAEFAVKAMMVLSSCPTRPIAALQRLRCSQRDA